MKRSWLISLIALGGCFFPADRGRLLEERVDRLGTENEQLKKELSEARSELTKTTAGLQEALSQLDTASRTTGANIGVKLDSAIQDVASLRGELESQSIKLQQLEAKASAPAAGADQPKVEELKRPDEPKAFLALAEDKAKGGEIDVARKLYNEFLRKWPKDEGAGEAHYAIGTMYFREKKCREALYEFSKVISDFPKSKSAPGAYLESSDCFRELKMTAEAKLALEELQKQYPKSDAAKTAKQKLAELSKAAPKKK